MTLKRDALLSSLLRSLVDEWGYLEVSSQLDKIAKNDPADSSNRSRLSLSKGPSKNSKKLKSDPDERVDKKIATYINYIHNIKMTSEKRSLILKLITGFKDRIFLPTTGSVRIFLDNQGIPSHNIKQRADALDKIFEFIVDMPEDRIVNIIKYEINLGPSHLSTISDAISAKRDTLRADFEENLSENIADNQNDSKKGVVPDSEKSD